MTPAAPPPPARRGRIVPALVCGIAGLWLVFHPMVQSGLALTHGSVRDGRLINYTLEHGYRWLQQMPPHEEFWNVPLFHPHPNVGAFTEVVLGAAPPYWIARLAGLAPDTAFQLWLVVVWSLNFLAAHVFLRRGLGVDAWPAALGAYVFAFGNPQQNNWWHPQLMPLYFVPLALMALWKTFAPAPHTRPAAATRWIPAVPMKVREEEKRN